MRVLLVCFAGIVAMTTALAIPASDITSRDEPPHPNIVIDTRVEIFTKTKTGKQISLMAAGCSKFELRLTEMYPTIVLV